jgi:outer membrane lipoprotein-sorting protein
MMRFVLVLVVLLLAVMVRAEEETPEAEEEAPEEAEETPEEKGLRIAIAADKQDEGFHSYTAVGQMILRDKQGRESLRDFHFKMLEVPDDGNKSLITFDRPSDIRHTALLTITHKVGDDDQWLYLPALKRVKRISSSNRSGAFLASEFAYEDFAVPPVERYSYKWLRDEPCPGATDLACHVTERYSTNDRSGYSRQVTWLDQSQYRVFKIDYYDRKNSHLKTLIISDYRQYEGRYWRASNLSISNYQTGKSTLLTWSDYEFGVDLRDSQFTKRALERGD